jgi:uncharacterized protein with beta-barrel porin domain
MMKRISKTDTARPVHRATANFGRGVDTPCLRLVRRPGAGWRTALLSNAAAGALSLALGGPAAAESKCVINGAVATCSGDQSAGIASGADFPVPAVSTLNVNNLTKAIAPTSGTNGISFISSSGDISLTSDTGPFGITTAGRYAHGIYAASRGAVTVTSTGNITTTGMHAYGIVAVGNDTATVTSTGNISTTGNHSHGIYAIGLGSNAVTVTSTGDVTTTGDGARGIFADGVRAVTVTSTGNLKTGGGTAQGIFAYGRGSDSATVTSTGNITTAGIYAHGIYAKSGGAVTVTTTGNVTTTGTGANGIYAYGRGAMTVTSTGNITTAGAVARGIFADGRNGAVTLISTGNVTTGGAGAQGISAGGYGAVTLISTGNVTTGGVQGKGIEAAGSAVTVSSTGNITTTGGYAFGIVAFGNDTATVTSTGNISTTGKLSHGIYAIGLGSAAVTVTSTGDITTMGNYAHGIAASGNGSRATVTVTSTGNVTASGDYANGISASNAGTTKVTSIGNITSTGYHAGGIVATGYSALTVTSSGNITTGGIKATGIYAGSGGGPVAVTINSGTVSGGSGSGAGVNVVGGTDNTLVNRGTVSALSGLAIKAGTGNDTVSNFGTVIGNVDLGTGANAFNNMAGGLFNSGASVSLGESNTLTNAGTLSPGGAGTILTTALTGNLVQTTTGRLAIDFNMAGGSADRVNVSGSANLAGTVQLHLSNPQLGAFQQTVVSAAGGTTNNGLSLQALSPALHAELLYPNANDVAIKSSGINFLTPGLTGNQTSLGNGLNGAAQSSGLGGPIFHVLLNGPTSLDSYRVVLNQLSGESATGTQQVTFDAMGQFVGLMLDPFNRGTTAPGGGVSGYASEGASAYAANGRQRSAAEREAYAMVTKAPPQNFEARWNVWAAGFGGSQTTDGNAAVGSNSTTSRIAAGAVGADYRIAPNTVAGFALAGGGTNFSVGNGLGSGRSDLFQAGAYVRHTMGPSYVAAALAYGWQDVTTNRTVTLAGLDQLQARFKANAYTGRLEGGYRLVSPWMGVAITPYAAGQFTTFNLPAYAEAAVIGSNTFALRYGAKDVTASRSELGFRTDRSWTLTGTLPETTLTLRSRFAWAHDYANDRSIGATFQSLPGASFVVNGAAQSADKALTSLAAELQWRNGLSLAGTFDGEFSGNSSSYTGRAVARYLW